MKNRVGLLGGTFNPIHLGHVDLGLKIQAAFQLDKILYILSAKPPHKQQGNIAPVAIRWEMLKKALESHSVLVPCDIEMRRSTYSWTFLTLQELKREFPDDRFYFISGSEGFLKIKTWKNYKALLKSLSFIVVLRKEIDRKKVEDLLEEENLTSCIDIEKENGTPAIYIYSYDSDKLFISSTLIRKKRSSSEDLAGLLDQEVKKIMLENKLYET
jgi:nicotinate-nucleotide adenylyltransferase